MKEKLLENKKVIIVLIVFLLLSVSGLTLAYFVGQIGSAATTNVNLTTKTVDNLTFTTGNDITIGPVNQANFVQGSGNKSGSTTASATLKANTGNNSATETYDVYLKINTNSFEYTTSNNTAELILKVTNPAGNTQTISGLTNVTSGGITGYDITTKQSIIPIATNYTITTTSTKTDTWTVAVYFINLNSDQEENASKTFNAEVVIEKREPITVTFDANGGSVSQTSKQVKYGTYYGDLPTPTKSGATFLGWNGKNMLNKDLSSIEGIKNEIPVKLFASTVFNNNWVINTLKPSTTYSMSYYVKCINVPEYDGKVNSSVGFLLYSGVSGYGEKYLGYHSKYYEKGEMNYFSITSTTPDKLYDSAANYRVYGYSNLYKKNGTNYIGTMVFSNIQLEEGSTKTLYEPYYVTSDVAVTQENNHTLTAIWG